MVGDHILLHGKRPYLVMKKKSASFIKGSSYWLVPALSILVILQAVVLTRQLGKSPAEERPAQIPVPKIEKVDNASVKLAFAPSGAAINKGEVVNVDLVLTPKKKLRLDGVHLVVGFDPSSLQITKITTPKLFSSVSENKESEGKGRISLTFLEEQTGGLWVDQEVRLLTLAIKGIKTGESEVFVVTEGGPPQTVITETGNSKKVLFDRGNLKLVVY